MQPVYLKAPRLDGVCAAGVFEGVWRQVIHAFKYEGQHTLTQALAARFPLPDRRLEAALIVAVPLHPNRLRWRGYNQSALLVDALVARTGWPAANAALVRCRDTRPQVGLSAAERWRNVQDAFRADRAVVAGRDVVLVDDVFTTGATLSAAAEALRQAGAATIWAMTLACAG
ncbi:MAG: ComF family protein [Anaerolineae bacterium]|nr:ComF family protein [Anaerolineae bacterium]